MLIHYHVYGLFEVFDHSRGRHGTSREEHDSRQRRYKGESGILPSGPAFTEAQWYEIGSHVVVAWCACSCRGGQG